MQPSKLAQDDIYSSGSSSFIIRFFDQFTAAVVLLVFLMLGLFLFAGSQTEDQLAVLEPATGAYLSIIPPDAAHGNLSDYAASNLGWYPAMYVTFVTLPLTASDQVNLPNFLGQVAALTALAQITVQPMGGVRNWTDGDVLTLTAIISKYELLGLRVMIRFAHEMNGGWYPWAQQPLEYIPAFRSFTQLVRLTTKHTAMLWAPTESSNYPFAGEQFNAVLGSADYDSMDTDGDGVVGMSDDPYSPFYPGDEWVDWVGLTLYYFGVYPFDAKNTVPIAWEFYNKIIGNFSAPDCPCMNITDFYAKFCGPDSTAQKPMAISETGVGYDLWNKNQPEDPGELAAKAAWWTQVYNTQGPSDMSVDITTYMPKLKMVSWFDIGKNEGSFDDQVVDWSISSDPVVARAFKKFIEDLNSKNKYWLYAEDIQSTDKVGHIVKMFHRRVGAMRL